MSRQQAQRRPQTTAVSDIQAFQNDLHSLNNFNFTDQSRIFFIQVEKLVFGR